MTLSVNSKIFYPSHGAGWVQSEKQIEFGGEKKQYLEFKFINSQLTISTPIEKIDGLNIRSVLKGSEIRKKIDILKRVKIKKPKTVDFNALSNIIRELEEKGEIEAYVEIIQYCNFIKKEREKDGRLTPLTIDKHLKNAMENIAGELAVSKDIEFAKALMEVSSITGIKVSNH